MDNLVHTIAVIVHLAAAAVGVGGATVSDVLFTRFLRDDRISKFEEQTLRTLHPVLWIALAFLIVSGIFLVLGNPERYLSSSKFQLKIIVVAIIALNGVFLHTSISPKLQKLGFGGRHSAHHEGELIHLRRAAFASGAVSLTSWYCALILGALRSIPLSLLVGAGAYLTLLLAAVAVGLSMERRYRVRATRNGS